MFIAERKIITNEDGKFNLYLIGDLHADHKRFNDERYKKWRRAIIKDPYAVAIFMGDAFEGRTPSNHKHFTTGILRSNFVLNMERYVDYCLQVGTSLLKPISEAGRPLFVIRGNHDSYHQWSGFSGALSRNSGATYLDGAGLVRVQSGKGSHGFVTTVYAHHGSGGGKTEGPKLNAIVALRKVCEADIYCAAHVHDQMARVVDLPYLPTKGRLELQTRQMAFLRAPSFIGGNQANIGGYEQDHAYPATDSGLVVLEVTPRYHRMRRIEAPF